MCGCEPWQQNTNSNSMQHLNNPGRANQETLFAVQCPKKEALAWELVTPRQSHQQKFHDEQSQRSRLWVHVIRQNWLHSRGPSCRRTMYFKRPIQVGAAASHDE